jgi:predicted nuclease of predicted toxin-antitoxin system
MKLLLDVNTSAALSVVLMDLGHDITCVSDIDSSMIDSDILDWAVRENRIIITTDSDFEQLIWLQNRLHCGVLRLENLPRAARIVLLQDVLANHDRELEAGSVIIATQQKIRIRRKKNIDLD